MIKVILLTKKLNQKKIKLEEHEEDNNKKELIFKIFNPNMEKKLNKSTIEVKKHKSESNEKRNPIFKIITPKKYDQKLELAEIVQLSNMYSPEKVAKELKTTPFSGEDNFF